MAHLVFVEALRRLFIFFLLVVPNQPLVEFLHQFHRAQALKLFVSRVETWNQVPLGEKLENPVQRGGLCARPPRQQLPAILHQAVELICLFWRSRGYDPIVVPLGLHIPFHALQVHGPVRQRGSDLAKNVLPGLSKGLDRLAPHVLVLWDPRVLEFPLNFLVLFGARRGLVFVWVLLLRPLGQVALGMILFGYWSSRQNQSSVGFASPLCQFQPDLCLCQGDGILKAAKLFCALALHLVVGQDLWWRAVVHGAGVGQVLKPAARPGPKKLKL